MRLWIFGAPGSGKSVLARLLADARGVPFCHLDDLFWRPDWVIAPEADFLHNTRAIAETESWIIDGNCSASAPILSERASAVLWLDLPFRVTYSRVLRRTIARCLDRADICNGNRETIRRALSRQGMPAYALLNHKRNRRRYEEFWKGFPRAKRRVIHARAVRDDAERFCNEVDSTAASR